jgi:hypothetical protein
MPNSTHLSGLLIGHPAPQRKLAHPGLLLFALLGAPATWMAQLLYAFASTSYVCAETTQGAIPEWLAPTVIGVNISALAIAVATFAVALGLLKRTSDEHRQRSGAVLDAAEGRTRFLAIWGVFISLAFFVATLVGSFSLFLVRLCRI